MVGDNVYFRVKPKRIPLSWEKYAKLLARYCGPFEVIEIFGPVA